MKNLKLFIFIIISVIIFFACNTPENKKSLISEKPVFEKGETENEQFDSIRYSSEDITERSWVSYYKNGVIKEKGQNVDFNGCGMFGDTLFFYDTLGNLSKTEFYENYSPHESASCHETRTNISIKEYYSNGKLKASKQVQTCYDCEETKIGAWMYFNKKGGLDSTMIFTP